MCTFTQYFLHFTFFVIDRTRKQILLIKRFTVFFKDRPSLSQSNVEAVSAENEEQYTLSNIIHIKFQKCYLFSLRSALKKLLLKCRQTNEKISVISLFFVKISGWGSAALPKICISISIFQGFCSDLQLSIKSSSTFYEFLSPRKALSSGC